MRFFEISSGLRVPVSAEEQEVLDMAIHQHGIDGQKLPERQQELARLMTSRGLLNRRIDGKKVYYDANSDPDLWRM